MAEPIGGFGSVMGAPVLGGQNKAVKTAVAAAADQVKGSEKPRDARETAADMERFRGQERVAERGAMPEGPLETTSDGWGSSGFGQGALDSAYSELMKLQKELEGLGSGPEAMAKSMSLQFKMQNIQQVITAVTKIREMVHESIMRTFSA